MIGFLAIRRTTHLNQVHQVQDLRPFQTIQVNHRFPDLADLAAEVLQAVRHFLQLAEMADRLVAITKVAPRSLRWEAIRDPLVATIKADYRLQVVM